MPWQGLFHSLVSKWTVAMSFGRIDGACRQEWHNLIHISSPEHNHITLYWGSNVLRVRHLRAVYKSYATYTQIFKKKHTMVIRVLFTDIISNMLHWPYPFPILSTSLNQQNWLNYRPYGKQEFCTGSRTDQTIFLCFPFQPTIINCY